MIQQDNSQNILSIGTASGKVLLAGGYGVLQQHNYGLTLAVNNNFYCICTSHQPYKQTIVEVQSIQIHQNWKYKYAEQGVYEVEGKNNPFLSNAIRWTLKYFGKESNWGQTTLKIVFDRGFISDSSALESVQCKYPHYKEEYSKTGLGSSACVLVSVVKCLVSLQNSQSALKNDINRIVNVISHLANLSAQNKIGSNFDISTAVFGTHLYKNILPHRLYDILGSQKIQWDKLIQIDPEIKKIPLKNDNLVGYMIDIHKGADTRVMVKGFLSKLKQQHKQVQQQFYTRSKNITLSLCQALSDGNQQRCRQINKQHRALQQKYSQITGIPIQPNDLTPFINSIMQITDVWYAICPGSGGYDAVFVLANQASSSSTTILKKLKSLEERNGVKQVNINMENNENISEEKKKQILRVVIK